jgi:hypothetical protein
MLQDFIGNLRLRFRLSSRRRFGGPHHKDADSNDYQTSSRRKLPPHFASGHTIQYAIAGDSGDVDRRGRMDHDFLGVYRRLIEAQSVAILIRGSDARSSENRSSIFQHNVV